MTSETSGNDLTGLTIGRFAISARLGSGGMGEVYRAEDTQLKRIVAIKRLARDAQRDETRRNELLKEAQRASALNNPRIAGVYDVFADKDELFLVMEYVDGITLRERMKSPIRVAEFLHIATQCVEALGAAHEKGILHGDLKPANIMLTHGKGEVKVCDFGLARHISSPGQPPGDSKTTARVGIAGTPAYMAPELFLYQNIDLSADIFSLGVVFYEMLAGRNPFQADNVIETIDLIRTHWPESLERVNPDVTPRLARMIDRMIEKDPQQRYSSIGDVVRELFAGTAELVLLRKPPPSSLKVRRLLLPAACVVLIVAVGFRQFQKWRLSNGASLPAEINLAILPFSVSDPDPNKQFFSQGLTETLNMQLSRLTPGRNLQIANAGDVRARNVKDPQEAREQLGANMVLTGTLKYSAQNVQVSSTLIDTRAGHVIRAEAVTATASNPLDAEERTAEAVIRMLGLRLSAQEHAALSGQETIQPGAYDFFLQGRGYLLNFDRVENLDNAISVFRKALEIDPRYALAYAGLGEAYWRKFELTSTSMWVEPARAACEGALAIDPNIGEAHACLGMVLTGTGEYEKAASEFNLALNREPTNDVFYTGLATAYEKIGRPADAEQTYRRAITLRPNYWAAYDRLGSYYYRSGKYDDAIAMYQRAVSLSPDSFRGYNGLGAAYFMKDRTSDAIAAFQKSLAITSNYLGSSNLGVLYFFEGDYRLAADSFRKAVSLEKGSYQMWGNLGAALQWTGQSDQAADAYRHARELAEEQLRVNPKNASVQMALAGFNAALGDMDKARAFFKEVLQLAPTDAHTLFQIADFYEFRLRQRDEALLWLERAVKQGQTWREIDHSPDLRELRKDPRFLRLRDGNHSE